MASIVGGFILPHDPLLFAMPDAAPASKRDAVMAAFDRIRDRIGTLGADVAIIVGADHYILFGPGCLPSMLIGIGEVDGPIERFPGIAQGPIAGHPALAQHILATGVASGFDWAVAKVLTVDHSVGIPARLCVLPNAGTTVIPVYLASGVTPYIRPQRAFDLGQNIAHAVESWPGNERVVLIGSGGISHWVGMPQMGRVNEAFDQMVLDCVTRGDAKTLIDLTDDYVVEHGGNGALEIRHFLCVMGALPGCLGEILAYEAVPEWITGLGFAEIKAAAA